MEYIDAWPPRMRKSEEYPDISDIYREDGTKTSWNFEESCLEQWCMGKQIWITKRRWNIRKRRLAG